MHDKIGKYGIIKKVGSGSSGTIFLCHDPFTGTDVAVKIYEIDLIEGFNPEVKHTMFFNEANMVGKLRHPNILPILDAGEDNGRYYIVMENVQGGRTLTSYCKPNNLMQVSDVTKVIFKCAKALNYAVRRGVIHRDIKPGNIMLTQDSDVRIIDFGIAINANARNSKIDGVAGSPYYMSPEQIQEAKITHRSDLYSLGVVLYGMLTGHRPFRAKTLGELLRKIVQDSPTPLSDFRQNIPAKLESIVLRLLNKRPEERYGSGGELAAALFSAFRELKTEEESVDYQEQLTTLRQLEFFSDFSAEEIIEILRASEWKTYSRNEPIVIEGDTDDQFYVVITGEASVQRGSNIVGSLSKGECFGEAGYLSAASRSATIRAQTEISVISVSATLMEHVSHGCQLRFTKKFLHSVIERLQRADLPSIEPKSIGKSDTNSIAKLVM